MNRSGDWLRSGTGLAPRVAWAFATDAELVDLAYAQETGELFAVDESSGMYRLSRSGRIRSLSRSIRDIQKLAWCDAGDTGIVISEHDRFTVVNQDLKAVWSSQSPSPIVATAIDSFGHNMLICMETKSNALINVDKKKLAQFATPRPVKFAQFATTRPLIVTSAEGELAGYSFDGQKIWDTKLFANIGGMSITGDGKSIFLAQYTHGIQAYDDQGDPQAAFVVEGAPSRVSAAYFGDRLVVATTERHLYWFDADGALLWAAETPELVEALICDPLGEWLIVGFKSGRILRLDWESA
jgi:outer membrane protein assembly factor BamB